jgi:hypothetical protein
MQHYSREAERSQQLIGQLQVKTLSYEAALVAIETCWDQVSLLLQFRVALTCDLTFLLDISGSILTPSLPTVAAATSSPSRKTRATTRPRR